MTTVEEHREIIKGFLDDIKDKLRSDLLVERQEIVGFAASEAAVNLFALLLHNKSLVEPGFNVNHRFFSSERMAEKRFDFGFSKKEELLRLLVNQEDYRNKLCYGKKKKIELVNSAVENLFTIKDVVESILEEQDDKEG